MAAHDRLFDERVEAIGTFCRGERALAFEFAPNRFASIYSGTADGAGAYGSTTMFPT